jgi:hypothetical protein
MLDSYFVARMNIKELIEQLKVVKVSDKSSGPILQAATSKSGLFCPLRADFSRVLAVPADNFSLWAY